MGSIRKRSGRYQAQVRRHSAQAVSRTFTTRKDALVWIRGLEARIDLGDTSVTAPKALTWGDLLARYCSEISPHKKRRTCLIQEVLLQGTLPEYGRKQVTQVQKNYQQRANLHC